MEVLVLPFQSDFSVREIGTARLVALKNVFACTKLPFKALWKEHG